MGVNSPGDRNLSPSLLRGRCLVTTYSTVQYTVQYSTAQYSTSLLRGRCLVTSVAAGRSGSLREGRNMTQPELSSCR